LPLVKDLEKVNVLACEIADYFYRLDFREALKLMPKLMEDTQNIISEKEAACKDAKHIDIIQKFVELVYSVMDKKDYILLGDLLKYEWVKTLGLLQNNLSNGESK